MPESTLLSAPPKLPVFTKEAVVNGEPIEVDCMEIGGQIYTVSRGVLRTAGLEDEGFEEVRDPDMVIRTLRGNRGLKPDLFTFVQRLPETEPRYTFYMEYESIAALRIHSYDHWWNNQIKTAARNKLRKSQKAGLEVREAVFDDDFVRGMVIIFNETPIRQGRRFWHYGKDFDTVKRQFSRFLFREDVIGAYYRGELIGFVMLADAGQYGVLGQIISLVQHRDKATNNALIAKAVEVCARKGLPYLVYGLWANSSLVDFKRYSGFEEAKLPRYFVSITQKGKLALRLGVHRDWKAIVPDRIKSPLKQLRRSWHGWQAKRRGVATSAGAEG